jgi:hypothetical protein
MAPEQWEPGQPVSNKVDVYALGIMAYRILSGRLPFIGETIQLHVQHAMKVPPSLRDAFPELPAALCTLIEQMLAKDPQQRPSMVEVLRTLDSIPEIPQGPEGGSLMLPDSLTSEIRVSSRPEAAASRLPADELNAAPESPLVPSQRTSSPVATVPCEPLRPRHTLPLGESGEGPGQAPGFLEQARAQQTTLRRRVTGRGRAVLWFVAAGELCGLVTLIVCSFGNPTSSTGSQSARPPPQHAAPWPDLLPGRAELADTQVHALAGQESEPRAHADLRLFIGPPDLAELQDLRPSSNTPSDLPSSARADQLEPAADLVRKPARGPVVGAPRPSGLAPVARPEPQPCKLSPQCKLTPSFAGPQRQRLIEAFEKSGACPALGSSIEVRNHEGVPEVGTLPVPLIANRRLLLYSLQGAFPRGQFPPQVTLKCSAR